MSAVLPEEYPVGKAAIFCCARYIHWQRMADTGETVPPVTQWHEPDCRAGVVNRRLAGEEPVAMLKWSMKVKESNIYVWKDNLPLTLLDRQSLVLLGTSDGRIGVATPRMVDNFNLDVLEAAMRYQYHGYHGYRYEEPECCYALEPLESHGTEFAYTEPNLSTTFYMEADALPLPTKSQWQRISLNLHFRKLDGHIVRCAILPNKRWVVYDPERHGTYKEAS